MRFRFLYSLFTIFYFAALAHAEPKPLPTKDTIVGHLAILIAHESVTVSPDQEHLTYAAKWGDPTLEEKGIFLDRPPPDESGPGGSAKPPAEKQRSEMVIYRDDKFGPRFSAITVPVFSPDSQHLAYAGEKDDQWKVMRDGKAVLTTDGVPVTPISFSPDSQRMAIVHQQGRLWHVGLDEKDAPPSPGHDAIGNGTVSFSPDSKHIAYVANDKKTWVPMVDFAPSPAGEPFDRFGGYVWKPDSSGIAFSAARTKQLWQVFIPSEKFESKQYDGIQKGSPAFSPDSTRFAFGATTHKIWHIITNDAEGPPLTQILPETITFMQDPDGTTRLLYIAQADKRWRLYIEHQPAAQPFDAILAGTFTLSPDRRHYAFAGFRGDKAMVIRDGQNIGEFDNCGSGTFAFSPDSAHLAFAASHGNQWFAVLDGHSGTPLRSLSASPIAFSPDSVRIAYEAVDAAGQWRLYVGPDADYRSNPYRSFFMNTHVVWRSDGKLATLGIQKALALRIEAAVPP